MAASPDAGGGVAAVGAGGRACASSATGGSARASLGTNGTGGTTASVGGACGEDDPATIAAIWSIWEESIATGYFPSHTFCSLVSRKGAIGHCT